MFKRVVITLVLLMGILGTCYAEQWEEVDKDIQIDVSTIKHIQVDYDDIIKVNTKSPLKDNGYSLGVLLINTDNKTYCYQTIEQYDSKGKLTYRTSVNPKDKNWWFTTKDDKWIQEIIKRAS